MPGFLDPTILFFVFGVCAGLLKSNLEIPSAVSRFLSLYLLMALGLKGGFALAHSGLNASVGTALGAAVLLAIVIPLLAHQVLVRLTDRFNAAALAAGYGSVSAVTFITATQMLEAQQIPFGGHMAAAMALMESPAIIIAVFMAHRLRSAAAMPMAQSGGTAVLGMGGMGGNQGFSLGKLLHESFTDGAQLLLLGSLAIGWISGEAGLAMLRPFSVDLFKGMLAFFLLDMGLLAARNLPGFKPESLKVMLFALLAPPIHAALALALATALHLPLGDTVLLMVLAASASYIAVPAVVRYAIPEANPSLFLGMPLGVTFPLNILLGLPLYLAAARALQ